MSRGEMPQFDEETVEKAPATETLEQTRHHYTEQAMLEESDDAARGGLIIKPIPQNTGAGSDRNGT